LTTNSRNRGLRDDISAGHGGSRRGRAGDTGPVARRRIDFTSHAVFLEWPAAAASALASM